MAEQELCISQTDLHLSAEIVTPATYILPLTFDELWRTRNNKSNEAVFQCLAHSAVKAKLVFSRIVTSDGQLVGIYLNSYQKGGKTVVDNFMIQISVLINMDAAGEVNKQKALHNSTALQ